MITPASSGEPGTALPTPSGAPVDETVRTLARALHHLETGHRRIRTNFAALLGLSSSEFDALMLVGEGEATTPGFLASELGLTTGAVTAMADRMDAAGLILRRPNPRDRRSHFIELAPKGREAVDWVFGIYFDTITSAVATSDGLALPGMAAIFEHTARAVTVMAERL